MPLSHEAAHMLSPHGASQAPTPSSTITRILPFSIPARIGMRLATLALYLIAAPSISARPLQMAVKFESRRKAT